MPLPSRSTLAGPPVVLDTALLPCSFLPPAAKETRPDCLCPDGCAPHGNVRYIAARLAAATILQTGSASTDILLLPTSPSVLRTNSNSGSLRANRFHAPRFDQLAKRCTKTSYRGHGADIGSLSRIPIPRWLRFVLAAPSTSGLDTASSLPRIPADFPSE